MNKPKIKRGSIDFTLFITVLMLLCIGIVFVGSASYNTALWSSNDGFLLFKRQILWSIIGIIAMIISMNFNYQKLKRYNKLIMMITTMLLFAVFGFKGTNGARRWINLGFASFQPSEIAKYSIVFFMAKSIEKKGEDIKNFKYGVMPYLITSGFFAGLVLLEKNLSIASIIMIVTIIILFSSGAKKRHVFGVIMGVGILGVIFIFTQPYRMARLLSFRDPWKDPLDTGYQLIQSLYSLGTGGILGVGLTRSRQKNFMPEAYNDFIFSVIGEEVGFIGCTVIILLFMIFIWRGIRIAARCKNIYGSIIAIGVTSVIGVQAAINIAVATGSMPVTGVPLPLISYGGSSLIFNMLAIGVLLNISRYDNIK